MIIGIDGNEANVEKQVGVSVYTLNNLRFFQKAAQKNIQFHVYLKNSPSSFLPKETDYFQYKVIKWPALWLRTGLPLYLKTHTQPDVFFAPAHYSPPLLSSPLVVTIHDLSYLYYPQEFLKEDLYKLTSWTKISIERASKIICVSQTTKKDVVKFYQTPENKIQVIYNGFEKMIPDKSTSSKKILSIYNLSKEKYLLYVGTLQPRKNILFLIKTFFTLKNRLPGMKLVIVGKKGWLYDEIFKLVGELGMTGSIVFTDFISDAELITLYQNAFCFVHPSLYEGFGIPLVEAMSNGCPVISSFTSSLPEIGGEACLYFDPKDQKDFEEKILSLYQNDSLRKTLITKGIIQAKRFSWKQCAKETLDLLTQSASV